MHQPSLRIQGACAELSTLQFLSRLMKMINAPGPNNALQATDSPRFARLAASECGRWAAVHTFLLLAALIATSTAMATVPDPAIPYRGYTQQEDEAIVDRINAVQGKEKQCHEEFFRRYRQSIFEHCQATGAGLRVGGGCEHIVGYSIHTGVLERALEQCSERGTVEP